MDSALQYPQNAPDYRCAIAISLVLIGFDGKNLQVLLARAKRPPVEGELMLPSRYVTSDDDVMEAALRMFQQMFGDHGPEVLEQLQAFAGVSRHPGGRVINVAHYALVRKDLFNLHKFTQHDLKWYPLRDVPELSFDHDAIVAYAKERLKRRIKRRPVGFNLLPEPFTLNQIQRLYEEALGKQFDRRNFRKKLAKTNVLVETDLEADGTVFGQRKGARLYRFNQDQYKVMMKKGYDFLF